MSDLDQAIARTIVNGLRDVANDIEALLEGKDSPATGQTGKVWGGGVFDPDVHLPPVKPTPSGADDPEGADWCGLLLFAGIYAINKRLGRRATRDEARNIVRKAGYRDLRGLSGWTTGGNDPVVDTNEQGEMKILPRGLKFLATYLERLGASLPADLVLPDDFADGDVPDID